MDGGGDEDGEVKEYTQMSGVNNLQDAAAASLSRNGQQVCYPYERTI